MIACANGKTINAYQFRDAIDADYYYSGMKMVLEDLYRMGLDGIKSYGIRLDDTIKLKTIKLSRAGGEKIARVENVVEGLPPAPDYNPNAPDEFTSCVHCGTMHPKGYDWSEHVCEH